MYAIVLAMAMQPAAAQPTVQTWCWRCPPRERRFDFNFEFRQPPVPTQPIYYPPAFPALLPVFPVATPYVVPQYVLPAYQYQPGGFSLQIRQGRF